MTRKEQIKSLVGEVGRFVAGYHNRTDPDDVKEEDVDLAYKILWAYDKLAVELNTDKAEVRRAICDAIEEFNLSWPDDDEFYHYSMEEAA